METFNAWIENGTWILFLLRGAEKRIGSRIVHTRSASVATRAVLSLG